MELTELEQQRVEKLERLRARGIEPYPHRVKRTHTIAEALAALEAAEADGRAEGPHVAVTGRLRSMRVMGKVTFAHIEDGSGIIQLFLRVQDVGEEPYEIFRRDFDIGDFVGAAGGLMGTRTGERRVGGEEGRVFDKRVSLLRV